MHEKNKQLESLYAPYQGCIGCHFKMPKVTQIVFGEGNTQSPLLFIGEAPGKDEDIQGRPFVGRSGKLLNRILNAVGSSREQVYITNIVKCRPPNNRRPLPQEIEKSRPLLYKQIEIIAPRVICTLGAAALEALLAREIKISQMRGSTLTWRNTLILPTFHPAYILRNPKKFETLIADIQQATTLSTGGG